MDRKRKYQGKKSLMWKVRRRYRWARINWPYFKLVLLAERSTGGELHAC